MLNENTARFPPCSSTMVDIALVMDSSDFRRLPLPDGEHLRVEVRAQVVGQDRGSLHPSEQVLGVDLSVDRDVEEAADHHLLPLLEPGARRRSRSPSCSSAPSPAPWFTPSPA